MSSDQSKSPMDHSEGSDENDDRTIAAVVSFWFFCVAAGPIALTLAFTDQKPDPKLFSWGVATSLLYVSVYGFFRTISVPELIIPSTIQPYLNAANEAAVVAATNLEALLLIPETYVVLFVVGAAIVLVGLYRMFQWEADEYVQ